MNTRIWAALPLLALIASPALAENGKVTFAKDVAPIFFENCVSCHRPGEIGSMSLMDYQSARPWAKSIKASVAARDMPPWDADSTLTEFANDRSLTSDQVDTIVAWVDQGASMGNPADMPEAPAFHNMWAMGEPDRIFYADREFTVPAASDYIEYQSIHFAGEIEEDLLVSEWEIRPTERSVVHHANLVRAPVRLDSVGIGDAVIKGGDYIGSYLPGCRPVVYPEGTALRLPKGNILQIQVHYIGGPVDTTDRMMFGVKFAEGRVDKYVRTLGTDDNVFDIAPHEDNYEVVTEVTINYPLTIFSSGAHMHLRGKDYIMKALLPDGGEKLIASVPRYDFNWQSDYELANPIDVPKGTVFHITAHWDNSANNPNNPDPTQRVVYGPWTENEMLTTWAHAVLTEEKLGLKVENGRVVGKFDDALDKPHPFLLQTLPNTMKPKESKDTTVSMAK